MLACGYNFGSIHVCLLCLSVCLQACQYVTNHSEAEVVVVENEAQLSKFVGLASTLKSVKALVMYRGDVPAGTDCGIPVYTWDQFMEVLFVISERFYDASSLR